MIEISWLDVIDRKQLPVTSTLWNENDSDTWMLIKRLWWCLIKINDTQKMNKKKRRDMKNLTEKEVRRLDGRSRPAVVKWPDRRPLGPLLSMTWARHSAQTTAAPLVLRLLHGYCWPASTSHRPDNSIGNGSPLTPRRLILRPLAFSGVPSSACISIALIYCHHHSIDLASPRFAYISISSVTL